MTQGKGTVIVLTGTGGASQLAINTSDPKSGYFHGYTPPYWGTSCGGQTWAGNANAYKVFSISGNTGLVTATSNTSYYAILGPTATNATIEY